jgi:DNA-binding PadR family transcriptional regulator
MAKQVLGEFEHQVLLAALRLEGEAYSASIVAELERVTGREVSPAAVYIALRRLEEGGLATSEFRAGQAEEGGRERRYFRATRRGMELMRESRRRFMALWRGYEGLIEESR